MPAPQRHPKEPDLSAFAGLCTGLALTSKIQRSMADKPAPELLDEVAAEAKAMILRLAKHPTPGHAGFAQRSYYYGGADAELLADATRAFTLDTKDGAASLKAWSADGGLFDRLAELASTPDPEGDAKLAQTLAGHLCLPYEREGFAGLGFPLLGAGFRRSKNRVDGVTVKGVSGWTSSFENNSAGRSERENPELDVDKAAFRLLATEDKAVNDVRQRANQNSSLFENKDPRTSSLAAVSAAESGLNLGGDLFALPKTESPLPCVEMLARAAEVSGDAAINSVRNGGVRRDDGAHPFRKGSEEATALAVARWNGFVSRFCRAAVVSAMGETGSPFGSPTHQIIQPGPALRDAIQTCFYANGHGRPDPLLGQAPGWNQPDTRKLNPKSVETLAEDYKNSPATFAVQFADDILAGRSTNSHQAPQKVENEKLLAKAQAFATAVNARAARIASAAMAIAAETQAKFMAEQELSDAWSAAVRSAGKNPPTSKALGWALAHPDAASAAHSDDPFAAFCASLARPLGVTAAGDEQVAQVCASLAERGLTEEAARAIATDQPELASSLSEAAAKPLPLRGEAKDLAQDRFDLECRLVQAAFESKCSPEALSLAKEVFLDPNQDWPYKSRDSNNGNINDNFSASLPSRTLQDENDAAALEARAAAKRRNLPWLLSRMMVRIDELMPQWKAACDKKAAEMAGRNYGHRYRPAHPVVDEASNLVGRGQGSYWGPVEWENVDPQSHDWLDVVLRRSPKHAASRRQAESDGSVPGKIAAAAAAGFGLEAESGNELVAISRERLCKEWGLSTAGWKNLIKADQPFLDAALTPLFAAEHARLAARGKSIEGDGQALKAANTAGAIHGAWLSSAVTFNFDPKLASETAMLAMASGRAGRLARDWSPQVVHRKHQTLEGAQAFKAEAAAKKARLPFVAKAICERRAAKIAAYSKSDEWTKDPDFTAYVVDHDGSLKTSAIKRADAEIYSEWEQIADWIERSEEGLWQTLPEKPTWKSLWTAQKDWHDLMVATADERAARGTRARPGAAGAAGACEAPTWPTPLGKLNSGEWSAIELGNGTMLHEEGSAMRHCVSSYASQCRDGSCRIFSVRFAGKRVCTLELRIEGGQTKFSQGDENSKWKIWQNKGACNANVTDRAALDFCEQIRVAYEKTYAAKIVAQKADIAKKAKERREALKLKVG